MHCAVGWWPVAMPNNISATMFLRRYALRMLMPVPRNRLQGLWRTWCPVRALNESSEMMFECGRWRGCDSSTCTGWFPIALSPFSSGRLVDKRWADRYRSLSRGWTPRRRCTFIALGDEGFSRGFWCHCCWLPSPVTQNIHMCLGLIPCSVACSPFVDLVRATVNIEP